MTTLHVDLDHHLAMRLEALAMLQRETLPGLPFDLEDGARQALARGLDDMLRALLARRSGMDH